MKITENKLRNIIRQIIKEENHYDDDELEMDDDELEMMDRAELRGRDRDRQENYEEERARSRFTSLYNRETNNSDSKIRDIAREVCDHLGLRRGSLSVKIMDAFWKGNALGYVLVEVGNKYFAIIEVEFDAYIEEDYYNVVRVHNELRSAQANFNSMK